MEVKITSAMTLDHGSQRVLAFIFGVDSNRRTMRPATGSMARHSRSFAAVMGPQGKRGCFQPASINVGAPQAATGAWLSGSRWIDPHAVEDDRKLLPANYGLA